MKIAFICVENACRSQMAEAVARRMFSQFGVEFVSGGTHPAKKVDPKVLRVLKEEHIPWTGRPKSLDQIGKPDVLVTMGCDVSCPSIPGVQTMVWDIPDPRGKGVEAYRRVAREIKEKLSQLPELVGMREYKKPKGDVREKST